jgi:hypothetical protein
VSGRELAHLAGPDDHDVATLLRARATAAKLTETAPDPRPVSVRTRLPAANDEWNSRFSTAPEVPAAAAEA